MANRNYQRGVARECQRKEMLEGEGWVVGQGKGSKGVFDLMAARCGDVRLEECKATKRPYDAFPPAKRLALLEAAFQAGATAWLAWWPYDRKGLRLIPSSDWPEVKAPRPRATPPSARAETGGFLHPPTDRWGGAS